MTPTAERKTSLVRTEAEAAKRIHPDLAPSTMQRWRRRGTGPDYVKVGRRVGYTDEAIDDWLKRQQRRHTAQKT